MAKILLVEDDKSLREIYGVRLQAEGYEIVSAGDGEEALAIAIKERPDLIVSDVMMPKISGFDMLDILRSTTETKDIKVIMMTALSSEDQRARGESLGADRYLVKSQVGIEDVVRTVHDVMGDGIPSAAPAAAPIAPAEAAPAPMAPDPSFQSEPVVTQTFVPEMPIAAPAPMPAPMPAPELAPAPVEPLPAPAPLEAPAPAVTQIPVYEAAPSFEPVAAPAPTLEPTPESVPAFEPIPMPELDQVIAAPVEPLPAPAPLEAPAPVADPQPIPDPVIITPLEVPVPAPATLPAPTAPFSSDPPAGLADRIINPLPSANGLGGGIADIASQMNQELSAQLQAVGPAPQPVVPDPVAVTPLAPMPAPQPVENAVPPVDLSQLPSLPPLPPQPGAPL